MKRRVRPTLLLQLVTLGISVGLWFLVAVAATSASLRISTLIVLGLAWFIGIEMGLVAWSLQRFGARAFQQRKEPFESIWFVDIDEEERREKERLREATSGSPTLQ